MTPTDVPPPVVGMTGNRPATISLLSGIMALLASYFVGWIWLFMFGQFVTFMWTAGAVIAGVIALQNVARDPARGGRARAKWGIGLGVVGFAASVVYYIVIKRRWAEALAEAIAPYL